MILSCTQGPMKHDSSTVATSRARARLPCWAHEPSAEVSCAIRTSHADRISDHAPRRGPRPDRTETRPQTR